MSVEHSGLRSHELPSDKTTICLVKGDGVGPEVVDSAAEVLGALGLGLKFSEAPVGFGHFQKTGNAIPDETLSDVERAGVALFGAISSPTGEIVKGYRSPIITFRRTFSLFANLRPFASLPASFSRPDIDLLIVRENTEDLYVGKEHFTDKGHNKAIAERHISREASEKIAKVAFEEAAIRKQDASVTREFPGVTVIHKANVLPFTDGLFRDACLDVAKQFPQVKVDQLLVDTAAMELASNPANFNVIVAPNLYGDILSDEASAFIGRLGVAPSANMGAGVAVFEPVHGSAPKIAGRGIANPIGAVLSAAMLLDHIHTPEAAARVRNAVNETIRAKIVTPDLKIDGQAGTASTRDVTRAIISNL